MAQAVILRVLLEAHDARRLDLPQGFPETVSELECIVRETFGITQRFRLHFKDLDFGDFFSLTSTSVLMDKATLKVVYIEDPMVITLNLTDVSSTPNSLETSIHESEDANSSWKDTSSMDTVILSSPEHSTQRSQTWPSDFPIPRFAYDTELVLASGNDTLKKTSVIPNFTPVLADILEKLAESIFQYAAYPSSVQLASVAEALVTKHPCLKEPGSFNGCYGWQQRLKYKMGNYRCKLRGLGCPELEVNSLKKKRPLDQKPAKNIKKPRKAEVNYLPPHPQGDTVECLELERIALLNEVKKKNSQTINIMMAKTFSIRRQEVVNEEPPIRDFMDRWPALFDIKRINEEFKRITTINLEANFMGKLDRYLPKMMALFSSRGGAGRMKIHNIKKMLLEVDTIERRREVAIRCLVVYLGEKENDLLQDEDEHNGEETVVLKIRTDPVSAATIIIEGNEVLGGMDPARACAVLMGLIYALNISYPQKLKHTFEFFQKVLLELDGLKASPKVMSLKTKLLSSNV